MRTSIKELRLARGWSQQRLAEQVNMTARRISRIEAKGGTVAELDTLAAVFCCTRYHLLDEPVRANGRPRVEGRELLDIFRQDALYDPSEGRPAKYTLPAARKAYPQLMVKLEHQMQRYPEWRRDFLDVAPSRSSLETVGGTRATWASRSCA